MWYLVCGVFLDLSKAFDRVWHEGFLSELTNSRISRNVFGLIESFFITGAKELF